MDSILAEFNHLNLISSNNINESDISDISQNKINNDSESIKVRI